MRLNQESTAPAHSEWPYTKFGPRQTLEHLLPFQTAFLSVLFWWWGREKSRKGLSQGNKADEWRVGPRSPANSPRIHRVTWLGVSLWGTQRAQRFRTLRCEWRILSMLPVVRFKVSFISSTVIRGFSSISSFTRVTFSSIVTDFGRPQRSLSSNDLLPKPNSLNQLYTVFIEGAVSPKHFDKVSKLSVYFFPCR